MDLMPAVPRLLNDAALISGRNSLALFIMAVFESELFNSLLAKDKKRLSNKSLRAPGFVYDSKIFGKKCLRFVLQL